MGAPSSSPSQRRSSAAPEVVGIRERRLSLAGASPTTRRVALGRRLLAQAQTDKIVVRSGADGTLVLELPAEHPRQAVALPGGSVLVAALDFAYRFEPGRNVAQRLTRLSLLRDSELHARRESAEHVWVLQPTLRNVLLYSLLPDAGLGPRAERTLPGFDGVAFTTLLDGSFLFTAGSSLTHQVHAAQARSFPLPSVRVWRLLAAPRIDRALVVSADGAFTWLEIGERLLVVKTVQTGVIPFDVAATSRLIALVSVIEAGNEPRRFLLNVYTADGELRFSTGLPAVPVSAADDWAANVVSEMQVSVGDEPPRVAVGGRSQLLLFDAESGKRLFPR